MTRNPSRSSLARFSSIFPLHCVSHHTFYIPGQKRIKQDICPLLRARYSTTKIFLMLCCLLTVFCGHTGHTTGQTSFLKCTAPQFAFFAIQISPLYLRPLSNLISTEIKIHINQWQVNSSWTITNCPKTMPVNLRIDRQYKLCIQSSCWLFVFFGREFCNKSNVSVFQAMRIFLWLGPPHGKGLVVVAEACHRIFVVFLDRLLGQTSLLLLPHCSSPNRSLSFSVFALEEGVVFQFLQNVHLLSF